MVSDLIVKTKAAIAQLTDQSLVTDTVDTTNCDREPIHTPAHIQPHGVMLVLHEDDARENNHTENDWPIIQASANTEAHLGRSPQTLISQPLSLLLDLDQRAAIQSCLHEDPELVSPLRFEINVADAPTGFAVTIHRSAKSVIILELEPTSEEDLATFFDFHRLVNRPVTRLRQAKTVLDLCQIAVKEIQTITGYDRVMVYQFDDDGSGSVIAEAKESEMTPYLGLHYPPTDIPKQAKYLYLLNRLRTIPDVHYRPVPLIAAPGTAASVDMSLSSLRSVSPLHTEYLINMGVRATLAISLVRNDRLWGLLVCHHRRPRHLPYDLRTACEFLGQAITLALNAKAENEDVDYKLKLKAIQASFIERLGRSESLRSGLISEPDKLLALTGSAGVALCEKDDITLLGSTPTSREITRMMGWLDGQFSHDPVYDTAALREVYTPANDFECGTSGLLAIAISKAQQLYVLWFRGEVVQTVNWAGNPDKPVRVADGEIRLSPRQSFERWQQTVSGRSLRWKPCEIEAALELRSAIIGLVLRKANELAQLNLELVRSNTELDSFSYIASHDLKEPLRGIHNYSSFLIEDYGTVLGEDGVDKLNTLMRLTQRMEDLISSLLHYSRLGRADLQIDRVDLNTLVSSVIDLINMSQPETAENIEIQVVRSLPTVACDRVQVTELFTNLVTNSVKYNDKAQKQIEIGYLSSHEVAEALRKEAIAPSDITPDRIKNTVSAPIFYVRDNGIGIREKHLELVFRIFKRLHPPKRFGGGTGAGLTIAKKIVERHSGLLWVSSVFGEGTTFYFTLEASDDR